jgi:hypothetical protein
MTTLNVSTDAGLVTINWDNSQFLEQYSICQNPIKFRALNVTPNFTFEKCLNWWDKEWNDLAKLNLFDLSSNSKIIDIGSGIGILSLITYKYLKLQDKYSTHFLVDREGIDRLLLDFVNEDCYIFYNNWEPLHNTLHFDNDLDNKSFEVLDPEEDWPSNVNLIISRRSLCYHFPYSVYRDKILNSLAVGGKLYLDMLDEHDDIDTISADMKSKPVYIKKWKTISSITNTMKFISTCIWVRLE